MATREKRTFRAKMPETQEALVDCVKGKKTAIVLKHSLLVDMTKELNENKVVRGSKKVLDGVGTYALLASLIDPPMLIYAAVAFLTSRLAKDEIKGYDTYPGLDMNDENIIVLIRKEDYDPKYDTIKYDETYVKSVDEKPKHGIIKA